MQRALLLLLVCASYTLLAGGPAWTLGPIVLILAAGIAVAPRRVFSPPPAQRPLDALLLLVIGLVALQMVPLLAPLVSVLSPNGTRIHEAVDLTVHVAAARAWRPLSVEPRSTLGALATLVLGVGTFWLARGAFTRGGTRQFCRWMALAGGIAAVVALYHRASARGLVLGVVAPEARSANPFGAFVNRNHFAAWLLMAVAPVAGYLVAHARTHPAYTHWRGFLRELLRSGGLLFGAAALTMMGVMFLTISRSAAAAAGSAVLSAWLLARRRLTIERSALPAVMAVIGGALIMAAVFIDFDHWARRISSSFDMDDGASRAVIWRETLPIVRDFFFTGTGAGTFSPAMSVYQETRMWVGSMQQWAHFNNAHSHYLQVAAEGGLMLSLPIFSAIVLLLLLGKRAIDADRGEIFWIRVGAAAGLIGVAVQSIWEVALVMPANAILCGVLAGLLLHGRHDGARGRYNATVGDR